MASITIRGVPQPQTAPASWYVKRRLTDPEALALCDSRFGGDTTSLSKYQFEREWFINVMYAIGLQRTPSIGSMFQIEQQDTPSPTWRRKYTGNRLLPLIMRQQSRLTSAPVQWDVLPKSPDISDQQASKVAASFLFGNQKALGIDTARNEMAWWMPVAGVGLAKVEWDEWADGSTRIYYDPVLKSPIPPSELSPEVKQFLDDGRYYVESPSGDIRVRSVSPFELIVPTLSAGSALDSCEWVMHVRQMTMSEVWNRYPASLAKQVRPDREPGWRHYFMRRIKTVVPTFGYFSAVEEKHGEEMATIREMWEPPTRQNPDGRLVVCSQDVMLDNGKHPLKDLRIKYPFVKADYAPVSTRFWSKGMVSDLTPIQSELNRSRTIVHQIRDLMGQPKWGLEKGCGVNVMTSEPGQMVWINRGYQMPVPLAPNLSGVDSLHELVTQHLIDDLNTIASQQDVTQAKVPQGVRSGVAIQMLQEKDDSVLAPAARSLETAIENLGSLVLKFASKYYKDYRLVSLHGTERAQDVQYFRGDDLRNNDRVLIRPGSLMPKSRASEAEKVLELVQLQVLNPMDRQHLRMITKALDLGDAASLFTELEASERRAEIENERFRLKGANEPFPVVRDFDDHEAHLAIHNRFRNSDTYEMLPPAVQEAVDAHCTIHEQMVAAKLQQQMAMQAAMRGAPGEKGEASQPSRGGSGAGMNNQGNPKQKAPGQREEQVA